MSKYLLLIFIFSFFLLSPNSGKAENFELLNKDEKISIEEKTLTSFKEETNFTKKSLVEYNPLDPIKMLGFVPNKESETINTFKKYHFQISKIYSFIKKLSKKINQDPIEPILTIEKGRVTNLILPKDGQKLYIYESSIAMLENLENNKTESSLIIQNKTPKKTLAETNKLGITELVSRGESNFSGSPANRRHNIKIGAKKMRGILLKPDEEFSFNKFLGPVIAKEGFLPELVIKRNGTVPELGGGLCQVSTTTFRAAVEAGIPITERKNHSYAVTYYDPQGTDATIYPGYVDLKFVNDTQNYLLIWPYIQNNTLIFDFYGTKDDRVIEVKNPVKYDIKSNGSMKATWTRTVFKNGTSTTDIFKSNYLPPELFHKEKTFIE